MSLTFREVWEKSILRSHRWTRGMWTASDYAVATTGEWGEACNAIKKLNRIKIGAPNINNEEGRQLSTIADAKKVIINEIADTILYIPGLCNALEITSDELEQALRNVFNQKSEEYGFPERL